MYFRYDFHNDNANDRKTMVAHTDDTHTHTNTHTHMSMTANMLIITTKKFSKVILHRWFVSKFGTFPTQSHHVPLWQTFETDLKVVRSWNVVRAQTCGVTWFLSAHQDECGSELVVLGEVSVKSGIRYDTWSTPCVGSGNGHGVYHGIPKFMTMWMGELMMNSYEY